MRLIDFAGMPTIVLDGSGDTAQMIDTVVAAAKMHGAMEGSKFRVAWLDDNGKPTTPGLFTAAQLRARMVKFCRSVPDPPKEKPPKKKAGKKTVSVGELAAQDEIVF